MNSPRKPEERKIKGKQLITLQATLALLMLILFYFLYQNAIVSAFLGTAIATVSVQTQSWIFFSGYEAKETGKIIQNAYLSEVVKILLISLGFAMCFVLVERILVVPLLTGFTIAYIIPALIFSWINDRT